MRRKAVPDLRPLARSDHPHAPPSIDCACPLPQVCGIGSIEGTSFMFIGHQKGRNTKVRPVPKQYQSSTKAANWCAVMFMPGRPAGSLASK